MSRTNRKVPKARNWHCVDAIMNRPSASAPHGGDKREKSRLACRKAVDAEEEYGEDECVALSGSRWDLE